MYVLQSHLYGTKITRTPGQYRVDQRNSNSFYTVLLNKLNAIHFIISFITALFLISLIRVSYFCSSYLCPRDSHLRTEE